MGAKAVRSLPLRLLRVLLPVLVVLVALNGIVHVDWAGQSSMLTTMSALTFDLVYADTGRWFVLSGPAGDTPTALERSALLPAVRDAIKSVPDPTVGLRLGVEFRSFDRRWRIIVRGAHGAAEAAALSELSARLPPPPSARTAAERFDQSGIISGLWSKLAQSDEKIRMLREHLILSKMRPSAAPVATLPASPPRLRAAAAPAAATATATAAAVPVTAVEEKSKKNIHTRHTLTDIDTESQRYEEDGILNHLEYISMYLYYSTLVNC